MTEFFILNAAELVTANARRAWRDGREYLVAPATLLRYAVLPGSMGAVFYPREAVARNAHEWDHQPLVVYHPTRDGVHISAREPGVLEESGIGFIDGAKANGKLVAQSWFDVLRTCEYDRVNGTDLYGRLERGEPIELSTGLHLDLEHTPGQFCPLTGAPYDLTARSIAPDHVAILPDQKGACDLRMGCGVHPIVNYERSFPMPSTLNAIDRFSALLAHSGKEGGTVPITVNVPDCACYHDPYPAANAGPAAYDYPPEAYRPPLESASPAVREIAANNAQMQADVAARWAGIEAEAEQIPFVPRPLTANEMYSTDFLEEARAGTRIPPCDGASQAVLNFRRRQDAEVAAARGDIYRAMDGEPVRLF